MTSNQVVGRTRPTTLSQTPSTQRTGPKGENINVKARIVLLDSEGDAVGDWDSNEEDPAVVLHLFFHNNPYENRIDVRIAHRWGEGSKKQAPAAEKMFFRVYADQIRPRSSNPTESVPIVTCLHPSFGAIDEASMIRETDLHAALAWFDPISFGLFGDTRQLGPHSSAGIPFLPTGTKVTSGTNEHGRPYGSIPHTSTTDDARYSASFP
ncbi:unnamed protein product [Penicillium viridicatum]